LELTKQTSYFFEASLELTKQTSYFLFSLLGAAKANFLTVAKPSWS
jgi:hypothetical protein